MNSWNFFDKIYCINLYEQNERYNYITNLFNSLDIPFVFYRTNRSLLSGKQGCFESHINVINDAAKNKFNNIIIFEDDVIPNNITEKRINDLVSFIKNNDFDILYLGSKPDITKDSKIIDKNKNIYKIKTLTAHSYVLNKNTIEKLKNLKYEDQPIDVYYKKKLENSYAIYDSMFYPGSFESSINKNFSLYTHSPSVMFTYIKLREKYAYNIQISIIKLFIILLFIFIFIFYFLPLRFKV